MGKEELEKLIVHNQAVLDQMWTGAEANMNTLNQIVNIAGPGLITEFLQIVAYQVGHNINKRKLESL